MHYHNQTGERTTDTAVRTATHASWKFQLIKNPQDVSQPHSAENSVTLDSEPPVLLANAPELVYISRLNQAQTRHQEAVTAASSTFVEDFFYHKDI